MSLEIKYDDLIKLDSVGAILYLNELDIFNRFKTILFIIDNLDVDHPAYSLVLGENFRNEILIIKKFTHLSTDELVNKAVEEYNKLYFEEEIIEEVIIEEVINLLDKKYLLISYGV